MSLWPASFIIELLSVKYLPLGFERGKEMEKILYLY